MASDSAVFQVLQHALTAADLRQQVYANNIANADTPGYQRQDVDFESYLTQAMTTPAGQLSPSQPGSMNLDAMAQVQPVVVTPGGTAVDATGNNVDVDAEMASMAENQIRYNAILSDMQLRLTRIRTAIQGG